MDQQPVDMQHVLRPLATSSCCQGPLCRTPTPKTGHLPPSWRDPALPLPPGTLSSAWGAAMSLPRWLVLLASLVPPGMVPPRNAAFCPTSMVRSLAGAGCPVLLQEEWEWER